MVSPRRSSRARSTAHPPPASNPTSSSSSSSTRSRHQKHQENDSRTDFEPTHSRGADAGDSFEGNTVPSGAPTNGAVDPIDEEIDETGSQDDEITRCICGYQEYQGGDDDQADTDGLFIQCDQCHVWQHGFCVGITDSSATPENYYCERCKPELHKLGTSKVGTKISLYLPIHADHADTANSKESTHRRRTTMNSRDAEYDDMILQQVIDMSKLDQSTGNLTRGSGSRARKRGTSEGSDETKHDLKRQRTSDSPDTPTNGGVDSGDEKQGKTSSHSSKKARGAAARNSNTTSSAAGKRTSTRNRRSEKNKESRLEESEHSDEYHTSRTNNRGSHKSTVEEPNPPPPTETVPDTPQQSIKRGSRTTNGNGGGRRRGNRNASHRQSEDPHDGNVASPMTMARDHFSTATIGSSRNDHSSGIVDKPTKPRIPQARMSMNEMKKRVNGISEFITRTQIDMANSSKSDIYAYLSWMEEKGTPISNITTPRSSTSKTLTPTSATAAGSGTDKNIPRVQKVNGGSTVKVLEKATEALVGGFQPGALEIMEILSRKINHWQQQYGEKI